MPHLPSLVFAFLLSTPLLAQGQQTTRPQTAATLPELTMQWREDVNALDRLYRFPLSEAHDKALAALHERWTQRMQAVDFEGLARREQIDWLLLSDAIRHAGEKLKNAQKEAAEVSIYLQYKQHLLPLLEARSQRDLPLARASAEAMQAAAQWIEDWQARWTEEADEENDSGASPSPSHMRKVARVNGRMRQAIRSWYEFGAEYDPEFTWWCEMPWKKLDKALEGHGKFLEETIGEIDPKDEDRLIGQPIGLDGLLAALRNERIAYTPDELIAIAEGEFAWCETERARAASELGLGDDWRKALEQVRSIQVAPGAQPLMIRELADEATEYFEQNDLLTVPEGCDQTWRMQMMSPARQRFTPYFTGGEVISIAYPTQGMEHDAKMQSMRGNNRHFARATVHHELIPGHHLQGYMARRWNTHRGQFRTPFLVEGWALYWELRLWDLGFAQSPEDEIGMLFWRSHRCARILFSLNYHLKNWTAEECVDFLVERVGHDRRNASAEVRRSIQGGYGPLYQVAYMIGGLQILALHKEMVQSGTWTEKDFHDTLLKQGSIPVDFIRAALGTERLKKDMPVAWRFANE
ncbi:MAG: hypothetical protein ACI87O_003182 [Planctomycetota bacterium]|jgi:hypothetical protein